MILLVASLKCGPSVAATRSLEPSSLPCLDGQGQRELVAGCERMIGKERAQAARERTRADNAEARNWEYAAGGALGGAAVTAVLTILFLVFGDAWTK